MILPVSEKRTWIEEEHENISITRQCELIGISRSGLYYEPKAEDTPEDITIKREIDEIYTRFPFYGTRRIKALLRRKGYRVNRKRVRRYMAELGIQAIYPKPNLSRNEKEHKRFPYLLTGMKIERQNQVWGIDITYIRLRGGFVYLVAIIDWYSRFVVSWKLSNTLSTDFCIQAVQNALAVATPKIINSDQGVQFTSKEYINLLTSKDIQISMDHKGRCFDNIFTERLWRTVKHEEVYLNEYESVAQARSSLREYFQLYNFERLHEALGYKTPAEVYIHKQDLDYYYKLFHQGLSPTIFLS